MVRTQSYAGRSCGFLLAYDKQVARIWVRRMRVVLGKQLLHPVIYTGLSYLLKKNLHV